MTVQRLWLRVREAAPLLGRSEKAIYEQIRLGRFPFVIRRSGGDSGAIYISARDIGLLPSPGGAEKEEAQNQGASLAAVPTIRA